MISTTECHPDPMRIIDGPKPDSPAAIVYRAAKLLETRATAATAGPWNASPVYSRDASATSGVYSFAHPAGSVASEVVASGRVKPGYGGIRRGENAEYIAAIDPEVALLIANAWGHQADDMGDGGAHFHSAPIGWCVADEYGQDRHDWTATARAALKYLRESAPEVS
jgi:hypothetical protein